MYYGRPSREDSRSRAIPLLLAAATLALTAVALRRRAAPRTHERVARAATDATLRAVPEVATPTPDTQHASTGAGVLIHRQYEIHLQGTEHTASSVCRLMQRHMAELAPAALAEFEKADGSEFLFRVGDTYDITMLGPWNGSVRVDAVTDASFTLVTLDGHPEAGQITFSVHDTLAPTSLRVLIESWARSRDNLVQAAYRTFGIGRHVQTEVWITFLQRLGTLAGVNGTPEVRVTTEEISGTEHRAVSDG
jgi:Domain of unknown function (DUF1990)